MSKSVNEIAKDLGIVELSFKEIFILSDSEKEKIELLQNEDICIAPELLREDLELAGKRCCIYEYLLNYYEDEIAKTRNKNEQNQLPILEGWLKILQTHGNVYEMMGYLTLLQMDALTTTIGLLQAQNDTEKIMLSKHAYTIIYEAINDNLEAMAKQLYDYWFVQFDFPNEEGKPYKSSGGIMVWNEKLKREIPEGWSCGKLSDIANITMGQSPDGSSYNENGDGILFYQGSTDFGLRFPSVRQYTNAPSRYAYEGDVLMSVRAPVGALNIANNDCCIGRGLAALNSKIGSVTHLYYILYGLKVAFEQRNTAGTTFGSITKDDLHSLPIVKPADRVVKSFEQICKPIFDNQMIIGKEIENLTKQRNELLPLLMNGQVSVNYHLSHD